MPHIRSSCPPRDLLIRALRKEDELTEAEIFAADLLRYYDVENSGMHAVGVRLMLATVERFQSDRPLFKMASIWTSVSLSQKGSHNTGEIPTSNGLAEWVDMWTLLEYTNLPRGSWGSPLVFGTNYWLFGILSQNVFLWLEAIMAQELWGRSLNNGALNKLIEVIKAQVADAEFHPVWRIAERAYLNDNDQISSSEQVVLAGSFGLFTLIKHIVGISNRAKILAAVIDGGPRKMSSSLLRRYLLFDEGIWGTTVVFVIPLIIFTFSGEDPRDGDSLKTAFSNCRTNYHLRQRTLYSTRSSGSTTKFVG